MKTFFCYCESNGELLPDSIVYKVEIGTSQRGQTKKALVDQYAVDNDFFFRQWDSSTEFELKQRSSRLISDCSLAPFGFEVVRISITELFRRLMNGTLPTYHNSPLYYSRLFRIQSMCYPSTLSKLSNLRKKQYPTILSRKNLSRAQEDCLFRVGFAFILILIMFLFGAYLEGVERLFY